MKELLSLKNSKKGLVIHHWDTDGLCSAALLARFFSKHLSQIKLDFLTPTINNYYLLPTEVESIEKANYNFIVTCDINFSEKEIKNLSSICPTKVFVFDHHKQTPYKEVFYYNKPYPSCSLVIVEYLQQKIDLLTSLGAIGDKEEKIKKEQQYWPIIQKKLEKDNITLAEALHMRNLLDSCYMTNDYYSLNEAISILQDDPLIILQDINLRNNLTKINTAVAEATESLPIEKVDNRIFIYHIKSSFNILSHSTRILSRNHANNVVVTWQRQKDQISIYIRKGDLNLDLSKLIAWARNKGCSAGGKEEVVGIIYKGEFEDIKQELIEEIKKI
jgi:oligoribonuclease NrnB/cAMP/cGMP phosphodiesterase (DHH superfamily)